MKKIFRFAMIIGLVLCFACCLTGCGGAEYDQNDIAAINRLIDEHGWDVPKDDVKAWDFVEWNMENPRRIEVVGFFSTAPGSETEKISGTLDLSGLTRLRYLECRENRIQQLIVPETIEAIVCDNNQLTELHLANMPNLQSIDCSGNQIAGLYLENLPSLLTLHCGDNLLTELALNDLPELNLLVCTDNPLASVQIADTPNLRYLSVYNDAFMNCYSDEFEFVSLDYAARQIVLQQPDVEEISLDKWEGIPENAVIDGNLLTFTIEAPAGEDGIMIDEAK